MKGNFTKVLQIGIVVDDLKAYLKRYVDDYGIGPWNIYHFNKNSVKEMTINGEKNDFDIKLALCNYYNVQIELIEPIDDKN